MAKKYALFIALILIVSYFSLTSGSFSVRPAELLSTLFQIDPNPQYEILLFDLRLPRVVMAAIIGLGLGIAGAVIQAITRNGLADPVILGINAGAGAGIVAFMLLFQGQKEVTSIAAAMGMPLFGLIGGLIAAILIYIFAWHRGNLDSGRIILVGIAINSGFSALSLFLSLKMDARLSNGHGVEKRKHLVCKLDVYYSCPPMDAAVYTDSYRQIPPARHHSF